MDRIDAERGCKCSTPFGITEVGIWNAVVPILLQLSVLNAFRHHRGGHHVRTDVAGWLTKVLNAFRHHRGGHDVERRERETEFVCSTPFGITEVGIPGFVGCCSWM